MLTTDESFYCHRSSYSCSRCDIRRLRSHWKENLTFDGEATADTFTAKLIDINVNFSVLIRPRDQLSSVPYSTAVIWSCTSTVPSFWWTSWRIFWPWKPLPRPSRRATMTSMELTSTESQPKEKRSLTAWPPGALSLWKYCVSDTGFLHITFKRKKHSCQSVWKYRTDLAHWLPADSLRRLFSASVQGN